VSFIPYKYFNLLCNFTKFTHIWRKSLVLLLKRNAALTMSCYQEFARDTHFAFPFQQLPCAERMSVVAVTWNKFFNIWLHDTSLIMDVNYLSYLLVCICSGFFCSLFSVLKNMERKPEMFLCFKCMFRGKACHILVHRWYKACKIETVQFEVLYMDHIMSSK